MRVLTIFSAYQGAWCAIVTAGTCEAALRIADPMGLPHSLSGGVEDMLRAAAAPPDLIAVVVGPGSFTGLRAGIALAAGIGLGRGSPVIAVSVAEALAASFDPASLAGRQLWTAIAGRRLHLFIDRDGEAREFAVAALPMAQGPVAICGNAANLVAGSLAARGADVMLTALRLPPPEAIARVAEQRARGDLPPLPLSPLYVEPPLAHRPDTPRGAA